MPDHDQHLRAAVRRLRDGLARELAGLNEDAPEIALRYAVEVLARELAHARAALESHDPNPDRARAA